MREFDQPRERELPFGESSKREYGGGRGLSDGEGAEDDLDSEDSETHATVLDKLLAWEKKLYEEVKFVWRRNCYSCMHA